MNDTRQEDKNTNEHKGFSGQRMSNSWLLKFITFLALLYLTAIPFGQIKKGFTIQYSGVRITPCL